MGHFAAVQAVDYNGDGRTDVLTGNQDCLISSLICPTTRSINACDLPVRLGCLLDFFDDLDESTTFPNIRVFPLWLRIPMDFSMPRMNSRTPQDGHVTVYVRERDVRLQEREGIANPFYDIGDWAEVLLSEGDEDGVGQGGNGFSNRTPRTRVCWEWLKKKKTNPGGLGLLLLDKQVLGALIVEPQPCDCICLSLHRGHFCSLPPETRASVSCRGAMTSPSNELATP